MCDPHVEALYYTAYSDKENLEYRTPAPVDRHTDMADYRLEDGLLTVWPKGHYTNVQEAQAALHPELEAWEAYVDLMKGLGELRFHYKDAELVDRCLPPPETRIIQCKGALACATASVVAHVTVVRGNYPVPPPFNRVDTDIVKDMIERYRQWQMGKEPLAAMAYAVLTRIEAGVGGKSSKRRRVAEYYNISTRVLARLGNLVSNGQGGPLEVRKYNQDGSPPMPPEDRDWLLKAIRAVIIQVATVEAGDNSERLSYDKVR